MVNPWFFERGKISASLLRVFSIILLASLLVIPASASSQFNYPAGVTLLDDFNRANGPIGDNWFGDKFHNRISNNQLLVQSNSLGSDLYWKEKLGADQEVFVTFTDVNEKGGGQGLLLKVQGYRSLGKGYIKVLYVPWKKVVQVWTWEWPRKRLEKYGDDIPVTFSDGDTFGARALANGVVEVYQNGTLIGTRDIAPWRFYEKGGYVGLRLIHAKGAVLDDFGGGTLLDPPYQLVDLQLLAFNDYHGYLESNSNPGPGNVGSDPAGGGEYLSTKLKELRVGHQNSLTVAAGDLIGGSPFLSGLFHDEPSVESLNAMDLIVSSVGNHEFDEGVTELLRMQNGGCHPVDGCYFSDEYPGANFQWLAANVVNDSTGETALPPYWIKEFDGVKVGFIGMTLEATDTLVAQSGINGWSFLDEADTANALVPSLRDQGVEAIVVLLHEGGSQTPPPGAVNACVGISGPIVDISSALDPAIDVLITGHTHLPYNCLLPDPSGNLRIVTSAYSFGRVVSEINLVLDKRTNDVRRDLSTSVNHAVIRAQLTPDPVITDIINKWKVLADPIGSQEVGRITGDIKRAFNGASEDRGSESNAGNMIADAQLWATQANGAQVAFMNPGGIRSDLIFAKSGNEAEDGIVTYAEAFTFQPFSNILMTIPMTGDQIVNVLEEQCQPAGVSRPFLHLGVSTGFTYELAKSFGPVDHDNNPSTAPVNSCTSVSVTNVMLDGVALDPSATYYVTVNNFLADGGDNFVTFRQVDPTLRIGGGIDLDELNNYLASEGPIDPPGTDRVNELP
jgi:5'-nucleotidase